MRILDRYVIRETIGPFLLALVVLTFVAAVNPMMVSAQQFLSKGVAPSTVGYLLVLLLPSALGITIPVAFLMGLLMACGRLSADRETVALLACGVSFKRLLRPILLMAAITGLATLYVMIDAIPDANQRYREVTFTLLAAKTAEDIKPRTFFEDFPEVVLYVQDTLPNGDWKNVMMASTKDAGQPVIALASRGQFVLDAVAHTVTIHLYDGFRYRPGSDPGTYDRDSFKEDKDLSVNPESVFSNERNAPPKTIKEMTIAELDVERANKRNAVSPDFPYGLPDHAEIIQIQQKFSFPVSCVVMALLGLGLGVHTRKEGKFAGFALGIAVIFVYYTIMYLAESLTKSIASDLSHWPMATVELAATWTRWVPNIILAPVGLALIWWRSRAATSGLKVSLPAWLLRFWHARTTASAQVPARAQTKRVVLVVRFPDLWLPRPRLLDLYVGARYLRIGALSFVGLLGLFYIATFIDMSDKLFKNPDATNLLIQYLWYSTPQFIYYLVPMATLVAVLVTIGALTKTSEMTVMRACGVSLYRVAAPLIVLALVWSGLLFLLQDDVMAQSNRQASQLEDVIRGRTPQIFNLSNRHWLAGENRVYYFRVFDPRQQRLDDLSVFEWSPEPFRLLQHTYAKSATYAGQSQWTATSGWVQSFTAKPAAPMRQTFATSRSLHLEPVESFGTEKVETDNMTFFDLRAEIDRLRARGFSVSQYAVALHNKIAFPLVTLVMTLIAVPFAVRHGRRGALYSIGAGIAMSLCYRFAFVLFSALGISERMPPALAAWSPDLLFLAFAGYLLLAART